MKLVSKIQKKSICGDVRCDGCNASWINKENWDFWDLLIKILLTLEKETEIKEEFNCYFLFIADLITSLNKRS